MSRACFYHIRDRRRIRSVLDFDTARTIGTSLVHSRLDYCNSMNYCLTQTQLNGLQHIQNALARAVVAAPWSSDSDRILKFLHWLKVHERIEYKVISTMYKHYGTPRAVWGSWGGAASPPPLQLRGLGEYRPPSGFTTFEQCCV